MPPLTGQMKQATDRGMAQLGAQGAIGPTSAGNAAGLVGAFQQAGAYSPTGSPLLMAALRRHAMRTYQNQKRRGMVSGKLFGLDPTQQRSYLADTERQAGAGLSDALNEAQYSQLEGAQQFGRGLYGQERGYAEQRAAEQRRREEERRNRGGFGAALGGLAGTVIGSAAGPMGTAVGGSIGKRFGGG